MQPQPPPLNKCLVDFEDRKLGLTENNTIAWIGFEHLHKITKVIQTIARLEAPKEKPVGK